MKSSKIFSLLIIFSLVLCQIHTLSCVDEHGKHEDWWVALRFPGNVPRRMARWDLGDKDWRYLGEGESLLRILLGHVDVKNHYVYAFNDEHPAKPEDSEALETDLNSLTEKPVDFKDFTAHAKGILVATSEFEGFFLLHSVPKYPAIDEKEGVNFVTPVGSHYGQTFMCTSITKKADFEKLISDFELQHSHVYQNTFPEEMFKRNIAETITTSDSDVNPRLLMKNYQKSETGLDNSIQLDDDAIVKTPFLYGWTSWTKPGHNLVIVFEDIVVPYYKDGFLSETWGRPYLPSVCDGKKKSSSNIVTLHYEDADYTQDWKHTGDHSKWGVSENGKVFCISDLNRQDSQKHRGGSVWCVENSDLNHSFKQLIQTDDCKLNED